MLFLIFFLRVAYGLVFSSDTVETWNFAWCHFKEVLEVRLICSEGKNGVSRALFHPEIASESNFDLESHLVLFLQHLHC